MRRAEPDAWTRKHDSKAEVTGQGCSISLPDVRSHTPPVGYSTRCAENNLGCIRSNKASTRTRELVHIDDALVERQLY